MPTERKTIFWWASVHGADPEPIECVEVDGKSACYTLGCADPFFLTTGSDPVLLISKMDRPKHPDKVAAERADELARQRAADEARNRGRKTFVYNNQRLLVPAYHGWRGPR